MKLHVRTHPRTVIFDVVLIPLAGTLLGLSACGGSAVSGGGRNDPSEGGIQAAPNDLTTGNLTYVTPDGTVQAHFDERLRPVSFADSDLTARLSWTDDAGHVDVETDAVAGVLGLDIDLSDSALLAAFDDFEAETGQNASAIREWIGEHLGRVAAVARGEEASFAELPGWKATPMAAKGGVTHQDAPSTDVQVHLDGLSRAVALVTDVRARLGEALNRIDLATNPELWASATRADELMRITRDALHQFYVDQLVACIAGSLACRVSCARPADGACCTGQGRICLIYFCIMI